MSPDGDISLRDDNWGVRGIAVKQDNQSIGLTAKRLSIRWQRRFKHSFDTMHRKKQDIRDTQMLTVPLRDGSTCDLPIGAYVQGFASNHKKSRRYEIIGTNEEGCILVWEICLARNTNIYTRGTRQPCVGFIAAGERGKPKQARFPAPQLVSNRCFPDFDPQSETKQDYWDNEHSTSSISLSLPLDSLQRLEPSSTLTDSNQKQELTRIQQQELLFEEEEDRYGPRKLRPEQQKFRKDVLDLYGAQCALCDLDIRGLLDAAHIRPKKDKGSDDPRNGLPLCGVHHRAFDAGLIAIAPTTLQIEYLEEGIDARRLRITRPDLSHLKIIPDSESIKWRYQHPMPDYEEGVYPEG